MTAVMPPPTSIAPEARRAALTLYAAEPADRDWVMSQLRGGDRSLLQKMLEELAELGIPRDPSMVRQALLASGAAATAQERAAAPADDPAFLDQVPDEALVDLLVREAPAIAACVLSLLAAARSARLLGRVPPAQRRAIGELRAGANGPLPSRMKIALLRELRAQFPTPSGPAAHWHRLRMRWHALWSRAWGRA